MGDRRWLELVSYPGRSARGRRRARRPVEGAAIFARAVSQGMSLFASAGDSGATDGTGSMSPSLPASDPNVTSVGGTNLFASDTGAYESEDVWNDATGSRSAAGPASSGRPVACRASCSARRPIRRISHAVRLLDLQAASTSSGGGTIHYQVNAIAKLAIPTTSHAPAWTQALRAAGANESERSTRSSRNANRNDDTFFIVRSSPSGLSAYIGGEIT
jgi:hypothetical protein